MKRCNENPYIPFDPYIIPDDLYGAIYQHLSPESKSTFSLVDKKRLEICSQLATAICFLPPEEYSKAPENIYQCLIERYPNIQVLTFESRYRCGGNQSNESKIRSLIDFLNANQEKHPLGHVKVMNIQEIDWHQRLNFRSLEPNDILHMDQMRELNRSFLSALSHTKLESITWKAFQISTVLRGPEIQPVLEKASELKHFKFDAVVHDEFNLSFEKQSELVSAQFLPRVDVGPATINSLSKCLNLKILTAGYSHSEDLQNAYKNNAWNLKRLMLTAMRDAHDLSFTTQMPALESLRIFGSFILDSARLQDLGTNCKSLKKLHIQHLFLNEEDLCHAFQGFSNLEMLIFNTSNEITEKIRESFKVNCPKLDGYNHQIISFWSHRWVFHSKSFVDSIG